METRFLIVAIICSFSVSTLPIRNGNKLSTHVWIGGVEDFVSTLPIRNGNHYLSESSQATLLYVSTLPIRNGNSE